MSETSQSQYFSADPAAGSAENTVHLRLSDFETDLTTDHGVFAYSRIDAGTSVLLNTIPAPPAEGNLLDLGCGYGPIAVTLATRSPQATVWAIDINQRAVELTKRNAESLKLTNVCACLPDGVKEDLHFKAIYANPPIRVGKPAMHALLQHWLTRLEPDGIAYLVVQKHLGSDSLAQWLTDHGWEVERLRSKQSYRVLSVQPTTKSH